MSKNLVESLHKFI